VNYLRNPWFPSKQTVFKNKAWAENIDNTGYRVESLLTDSVITQLQTLFHKEHKLKTAEGGMFYSVYSQNIEYRRRIHTSIEEVLKPVLESLFENYRVVLNSFVIKSAGPKSEFYIHQDTTGLDESRFSPLNLWIPLQDVDQENGCLGIVPYSHRFFTPYRSISFPAPFDHIASTVREYLHPIEMKAGEVLLFDNRLVHHSYPNLSGKTRAAVVCGLFPKEAKMTTCFKPEYELGGKVEFIEHEDEFLIENPNFLIDCQNRPKTGKSVGFSEDPYYEIDSETFKSLCSLCGIQPNTSAVSDSATDCHLISEPNTEIEN